MKRWLSLLLLSLTLFAALPGAAAYADEGPITPTVLLDGLPLTFDVDPMIVQGRTLVPFRAIAEALGVDVLWNDAERSILAYDADTTVSLAIDRTTMYVNGMPYELDVPPRIVNSRTLLPLRAFSWAFGAEIGWDGETYTVSITSPVRQMRMMAFYALRSFDRRHLVPAFSDVAYGWARLADDGSVRLDGPDYFWPEPAGEITPEVLLAEAAAAGTKRYLMIHETDGDLQVTNIVLDEAKIARTADSVAAIIAEKGFDGVLLDLEGLGWDEEGEDLEQVRQGFVRLVSAVSARMQPMGKETAVSLHPPNGAYAGYDYAALAQVADVLQIMAHDYVVNAPEPADRVEEAIRMAIAAVGPDQRHKLLLGIRFFETPETLQQKIGLAKRYRLGGISYWLLRELTDEDKAAIDATVTRTE